jgi:(p)ppGpp synthase/HD superfamily hydrolase
MFEDLFKLIKPRAELTFEKNWNDFRMYAISRHATQMYGKYPYAYHLAMVEAVLSEYGFDEYEYQAAAWLHDILEDTNTKLDNIYGNYGPVVTSLVYSVTGEGRNRKERNASIYAKLQKYPNAAIIKVADRIANMTEGRNTMIRERQTDKVEMYLNEWEDFKANVGCHLAEGLRNRLIWESLDTLVDNCRTELKDIQEQLEEERLEEQKEESKKGREEAICLPPPSEERTSEE